MASGRTKAIEEIDDILEMSQAMAALGISLNGLKTLDQMKAKVKEELNVSEDQPSWTAGQVRILQLNVIQNHGYRKKKHPNKHTGSDGNCAGQ